MGIPDDRILDPARRKIVHRGPEEVVRQAVLAYLTQKGRVPLGLISIEKEISTSAATYRADIVVHDRSGRPWMVVECKAPDVELSQDTFDQIGSYNRFLLAPYLLITNGRSHFCCQWDEINRQITFLEEFPEFPPQ